VSSKSSVLSPPPKFAVCTASALTNQPLGGVLCELVNDDVLGTMARCDDCRAFADRWGLKMSSVEMLAQYRRAMESKYAATS